MPTATPTGWIVSAGSSRFLAAIGVAVALHVALLTPLRFSVARGPVISASSSMSVRMLAAPASEGVAHDALVSHAVATAAPAPVPVPALESPPLVAQGRPDTTDATKAAASSARGAVARDARADSLAAAAAQNAPQAASAPAKSLALPPGLPPAPNYLLGGKLEPGPRPLHEIDPVFPPRAGQQQGLVVLRLLISELGVVDNVAVVRSTPQGYFEESALEAFGRARFSPGLLLGVPVKSQVTIEVEFAPVNRGPEVSGRTY